MCDVSSAPVDLSLMLQALAGNRTVLRELIGHMLASYPAQLKAMGDSIAAGDALKLRQLAHTFKGSIANFNAKGAVELALRLEQCGAAGELLAASDFLKRLEEEMQSIRCYLEHGEGNAALRNLQ